MKKRIIFKIMSSVAAFVYLRGLTTIDLLRGWQPYITHIKALPQNTHARSFLIEK
jgi:hypothetical protein